MKKNLRYGIITLIVTGIFYFMIFFLSMAYKSSNAEIIKQNIKKNTQAKVQIVDTEKERNNQNKEESANDSASLEKLINEIKDKTGAKTYEN